jgi:hypothetical protein
VHDVQMANQAHLEMRWMPVTDEQGRSQLQAVWIEVGATPTTSVHDAA